LVLSVASTRLVLTVGDRAPNVESATYAAGHVIHTFATFVTGGGTSGAQTQMVVGTIIFIILVVIQFIVITKGSGRISEVAARFTLDAMPGKQMAIDADLNAGLIKDDEAKKRRNEIAREAEFYGAMDGASKFVRGDAIAGIIIVLINIIGGILIEMLSPSTGVVNHIIKFFGGEPIYFMANTVWWRIMFVVSSIWKEAGWGTIIYLAAISGVSIDLYEAARIDGANRFQQALYITLPAIMPTVSLLFIMRMSSMMDIGFEHVYMLSNTYVRRVSDVFSTYVFRMGIERMEYSYTTAIGLFQTSVNFVLLLITNSISRRLGGSTMI